MKLTSEFVVIVIGVLVALGVDAAWEMRQDTARLERYLLRLEVDLLESERGLDEAIMADSIVSYAADRFNLGISAVPPAPADSLDRWLTMTFGPSLFHPRTGTLQALIQSGDLRLVEDAELHNAILSHATAIDVWRTSYSRLQEAQLNAFGRLGYFLNLETEVEPRRTEIPDWAALAREPGLISEMRQMSVSAFTRQYVLQRLRTSQRDLLQRLQARSSR